MMRSAEIDSRAASSRTARVASRLLYGPPNTIRGLSIRRNGIGLDIKPSPALCLAMIAAASPYSATPGWGTNISAGIGPSDERPAPSGKSGSYVLGGALCTSAECRPREGSRAPYDGKGEVGDGAWAPFRLLAFDHSAFIVALQPTLVLDETGDGVDALAGAQIAEHEGTRAAHAPGVALHDRERGADVGREIDFVDHEQVGTRDARATFGRNLVASGDVDDVERQVRELRRKCRGQVVAPGFDQNEIEHFEGNFFADDTAFSQLGLGFGQWPRWDIGGSISMGQSSSDSDLAAWRTARYSTYLRRSRSRLFSVEGARKLTLRRDCKNTEVSVIARADLLLVVTAVLVSAFFSPSMFSALAQTSTESGKEVREFRGIVAPARTAEISPRYNGLLSKIYFLPGQFVEEGNLLFEFRTNDQELAVEIDQSKLQRAEADLRMAELTLTNKRDLRAKKIISETETLQAEASRDIAAANVVEARLTVQLSESVLKNMKLYAP